MAAAAPHIAQSVLGQHPHLIAANHLQQQAAAAASQHSQQPNPTAMNTQSHQHPFHLLDLSQIRQVSNYLVSILIHTSTKRAWWARKCIWVWLTWSHVSFVTQSLNHPFRSNLTYITWVMRQSYIKVAHITFFPLILCWVQIIWIMYQAQMACKVINCDWRVAIFIKQCLATIKTKKPAADNHR